MVGDRFSSSTSCSGWLHETAPARPDPSLSCLFLKVATHPSIVHLGVSGREDGSLSGVSRATRGAPLSVLLDSLCRRRSPIATPQAADAGAMCTLSPLLPSQPPRQSLLPVRVPEGGLATGTRPRGPADAPAPGRPGDGAATQATANGGPVEMSLWRTGHADH